MKDKYESRLLSSLLPVCQNLHVHQLNVPTTLDKTVEKIAFLGVIFSKPRSRPILPSPSPPGSNVVGSSKESRIPLHL